MDQVLNAIDEALARTGLSDAAASKMAVGNYALIKNMRSSRSDEKRYSFQALEQLANVLGLECYFGPKRQITGFSEGDTQPKFAHAGALGSGYSPIPWHSANARRGSAPVALQQSWIEEHGLTVDHLQAVAPDAAAVSFLNPRNTVAIIATNAPRTGANGLWCSLQDGVLTLTRAAFSSGLTILLPSDDFGEVTVTKTSSAPFLLLGKVVWIGAMLDDAVIVET